MPIDLNSLKKLETLPRSAQTGQPAEGTRVVVLIKLHPGAERPEFLAPRAEISPDLFSTEVDVADLERIEHDPAVASMALSRALPMIE